MNPEKEAPRLLTHLIFDPIYKPALSTYYITYTLQIEVERTIEHNLNYHYVFSQSFENTNNFTIVHNMNTLLNAHILVNDQLINPVSITNNINEIVITLDEKLSGMVKLYDDIGLDTFTHSTKEYIFDYEQYDLSDTWTIYHYLELTMNADVFINGIKTIPKHISNDDNSKMIITFEKPMNGIAKLF
jgi:hypothetical protein